MIPVSDPATAAVVGFITVGGLYVLSGFFAVVSPKSARPIIAIMSVFSLVFFVVIGGNSDTQMAILCGLAIAGSSLGGLIGLAVNAICKRMRK